MEEMTSGVLETRWNAMKPEVLKGVTNKNLNLIFDSRTPRHSCAGKKTRILAMVTGSSRNTVIGWLNICKPRKKIPLAKLCAIADALGIPAEFLLEEGDEWFTDEIKWNTNRRIDELEEMLMEKFGVEVIANGKDVITIYEREEDARRDAQLQAANLGPDESVMLFLASCDKNGKLASNNFNIINTWVGK